MSKDEAARSERTGPAGRDIRFTDAQPGCNVASLNVGSSTVRFALHRIEHPHVRVISAKLDRLHRPGAAWTITDDASGRSRTELVEGGSDGMDTILEILDAGQVGVTLGVGHRVVHGGERFTQPTLVTPEVLTALRELTDLSPEHAPGELALIEALASRRPDLPQVACFDTAFHADLPRVARLLPIPRRFLGAGVRRYGFHGLSFAHSMEELERRAPGDARGRVVLAHLGSGASLAAVKDGRCLDTTMGFTPASGIMMATRSGDLDPGLVGFLAREAGMDIQGFHEMVHAGSGLLGVSETSADMRELLARQAVDERAADAVELFCHQACKAVGAMAAVLGGVDALVFTGGIGEGAPIVRARICERLDFLGVELDDSRNAANDGLISTPASRVHVHRLESDEGEQIARAVCRTLGLEIPTHAGPGEGRASDRGEPRDG